VRVSLVRVLSGPATAVARTDEASHTMWRSVVGAARAAPVTDLSGQIPTAAATPTDGVARPEGAAYGERCMPRQHTLGVRRPATPPGWTGPG